MSLQLHPLLELQPSGVLYSRAGAAVHLMCIVTNISLAYPDSLTWTFRGEAGSHEAAVAGMASRPAYHASQLLITSMGPLFAGRYTCRARLRHSSKDAPSATVDLRLGRQCRQAPIEAACSTGYCLDLRRHCGNAAEVFLTSASTCPEASALCPKPGTMDDLSQSFAEFARPTWRRLVLAASCTSILALSMALTGAVFWRQLQQARRQRREEKAATTGGTVTTTQAPTVAMATTVYEVVAPTLPMQRRFVDCRQRSYPCSPLNQRLIVQQQQQQQQQQNPNYCYNQPLQPHLQYQHLSQHWTSSARPGPQAQLLSRRHRRRSRSLDAAAADPRRPSRLSATSTSSDTEDDDVESDGDGIAVAIAAENAFSSAAPPQQQQQQQQQTYGRSWLSAREFCV